MLLILPTAIAARVLRHIRAVDVLRGDVAQQICAEAERVPDVGKLRYLCPQLGYLCNDHRYRVTASVRRI